MASLKKGECSCYGHFNASKNGHATKVASLKRGKMVMLQRCKFNGGNGHVTEVVRLRENGYVTEMVTLIEGEWSYYRGGQFKGENGHITEVTLMGGRMVMLQRWSL